MTNLERIFGLLFLVTISIGIAAIVKTTKDSYLDPTVKLIETVVVDGSTHNEVCSGAYIGDHTIITAAHCVADGGTFEVVTDIRGRLGTHVPAKVIWAEPSQDVATVRLSFVPPELGIATLDPKDATIGTSIEVIGNPLNQPFIHTRGHVSGVARHVGPWPFALPVDVAILPGNSGGPVYKKGTHKVIGVVVGALLNVHGFTRGPGTINFAVSSTEVLALIAEHNIRP